MYGQCIGDAVGLATEFRRKAQLPFEYTKGEFSERRYTHASRYDSGHSSRWERADFTDDSDQMLLVCACARVCGCADG